MPGRERDPDAQHSICALAQRIVAFRREVKEHVKESLRFSKRPSLAAKGVQRELNIPPLRRFGRA
jgi:hypothetical protein